MRALADSLLPYSGIILTGILSVAIVWLLSFLAPKRLRALWVVIVPFVLAYSLYWFPVWLGADPSEYGAWAALGIGELFFAGFLPSAVLVLILQKRHAM